MLLELLKPDVLVIDDFDRLGHGAIRELDALERLRKQTRLFLVTTNNIAVLDCAVVRPGRFDELFCVGSLGECYTAGVVGEELWNKLSEEQRKMVDEFVLGTQRPMNDEVRRSAPWSTMQATYRAHEGVMAVREARDFTPPAVDTVNELQAEGILPSGFRNSRDMAAHAAELRAAKCYLLSVYGDHSLSPMEDVAAAENVTITRARNLIDRARQHGYLTRTEGLGGELTAAAFAVACNYCGPTCQIWAHSEHLVVHLRVRRDQTRFVSQPGA
jgi:hypothetical protein